MVTRGEKHRRGTPILEQIVSSPCAIVKFFRVELGLPRNNINRNEEFKIDVYCFFFFDKTFQVFENKMIEISIFN